LSLLDAATREELSTRATRVGEELFRMNGAYAGCWSIDFAQDVDGNWWLIDMARGEVSFRCPGRWDGETFIPT